MYLKDLGGEPSLAAGSDWSWPRYGGGGGEAAGGGAFATDSRRGWGIGSRLEMLKRPVSLLVMDAREAVGGKRPCNWTNARPALLLILCIIILYDFYWHGTT